MPIYDYECQSCGAVTELLVLNGREEKPTCPDCGSAQMKKLISTFHAGRSHGNPTTATCCGRSERCETPPCSEGGSCHRG